MSADDRKSKARGRIDWDAVKRRLKESELALEKVLTVDQERMQKLFRRRAEQLAGRQEGKVGTKTATPMLVFRLAAERYAVELRNVAQVVPFANCTLVPGAPPQLLGVTNLRGSIRSVMDMRRILELPEADIHEKSHVLLIRHDEQFVGLRVDQVENVQLIDPSEVTGSSAGSVTLFSNEYCKGITTDKIIVLNIEAVFQHPAF